MATELKIVALETGSLGIELPESVLQRLNLVLGDQLWLTETPDGIELSAFSPEDTEMMRVARKVMRDNREVLKRLADS
jgi:antitoxin component of MazEF toxin-antitoxin module